MILHTCQPVLRCTKLRGWARADTWHSVVACSQRVYRQHEGSSSVDWERVFLCKKRSLFLGMIQFAIVGNVTDGSYLRITCFDELCALAGCKGTDVYLQSGI